MRQAGFGLTMLLPAFTQSSSRLRALVRRLSLALVSPLGRSPIWARWPGSSVPRTPSMCSELRLGARKWGYLPLGPDRAAARPTFQKPRLSALIGKIMIRAVSRKSRSLG